MICILSYREEHEDRCGRSCNCLHGSSPSDLALAAVETEEEAATWLAARIHANEASGFRNLVFDSGTAFEQKCQEGNACVSYGSQSIDVPYSDACTDEEIERREALRERLVALTEARLGRLKRAATEAKESRAAQDKRQQAETRLAVERADYERLQAKFGAPTS